MNATVVTSPWSVARRREWADRVALDELFSTEGVTASLGRFFDQRFIDYLDVNFDDLDTVNWRRVEALVAEHLDRARWRVELGPGRNDNGVDIRAWPVGNDDDAPATVLVQVKRERRQTTKTVVKALAADVAWEGAQFGLLVTTSSWSPGAAATVRTRGYPLIEVDRDGVRGWIRSMRTPGAGIWLGE